MNNLTEKMMDRYVFGCPGSGHWADRNRLLDFIIAVLENNDDMDECEEELERRLIERGIPEDTAFDIKILTDICQQAISHYIKKKSEEC